MVLAVGKPTMVAYGVSILELVLTLGAFYLLYYGWKQKVKTSYLLYSFVALVIPTLTGTFTSMPRYILTIVPLFMILGLVQSTRVRYALLIVSVILEIMATTLFLRGWFIA